MEVSATVWQINIKTRGKGLTTSLEYKTKALKLLHNEHRHQAVD